MSQETMFRDAVDALRARGSRFAREAYVFVVAALGETVRALPPERLGDPERRHLSGQELTAGVIRIARDELGSLAALGFPQRQDPSAGGNGHTGLQRREAAGDVDAADCELGHGALLR